MPAPHLRSTLLRCGSSFPSDQGLIGEPCLEVDGSEAFNRLVEHTVRSGSRLRHVFLSRIAGVGLATVGRDLVDVVRDTTDDSGQVVPVERVLQLHQYA